MAEGRCHGSKHRRHSAAGAVCMLDVPVNKTSSSFTKPVDRIVGEAIATWEKVRL